MEFDDSLHGGPCPLCLKLGQDWLLKLSPLNEEEAVFFCTNPECAYPIGTLLDVRSEWVVPFKLRDWIRRSIRKRHTTGTSGTGSLGRPCSNLANTSASDSPLCHLSSTQTSPALSTISTISSTSSKQAKVSPIQLYSLNSPGTLDAGSSFQSNLEARYSTSIEEGCTSIIKTDSSLTGLSLFDIDSGTSENRQDNENVKQHIEDDSSLNLSYTKASGKAHERPEQNNDVVIDMLEEAYKERIGDKLAMCTNHGQQLKGQISASSHYGVQIQCFGGSTNSETPNTSVGNCSIKCETEHAFSTDYATSFDYAKPIAPSGISQLSTQLPLFNSIEGEAVKSYFPLSSMVELAKPLDAPICYDIDERMNVHEEIEQAEDFSFLDGITAAEENQPVGQATMLSCSREVSLPINVETPCFSVYSDLDINYSLDLTNQQQEESVSDQKLAESGQNCSSLQNGNNTSLGAIPVDITHNEFDFETMMETDVVKIKEELDISSESAKNDAQVCQSELLIKSKNDEFLQKLMKHFQRKLKKSKRKSVKPKADVIDKKQRLNVSLTENSSDSTSQGNEAVLYSGTLVIDNIEIASTLETPTQHMPESVSSDKTPVTSVEQTSVVVDSDAKAVDVNQSSSIVNIVQRHSKDPNIIFEYCVSLESAPKSTSDISKFNKGSDKIPAEETEPSGKAKIPACIANLRSEAASSVVEKPTDLTPKKSPFKAKNRNASESFSADTRGEILKAYAELEVKCGRNWKLRTRRGSASLTDILGVKPLNPCPLERPVNKSKQRRRKKLKNE